MSAQGGTLTKRVLTLIDGEGSALDGQVVLLAGDVEVGVENEAIELAIVELDRRDAAVVRAEREGKCAEAEIERSIRCTCQAGVLIAGVRHARDVDGKGSREIAVTGIHPEECMRDVRIQNAARELSRFNDISESRVASEQSECGTHEHTFHDGVRLLWRERMDYVQ